MQKYLLVLGLLCCFACKKNPAPSQQPFRFDDNYTINHHLDNDVLSVVVNLKNGLHAYGFEESIGKPINLKINQENGWMSIGKPKFPNSHKTRLKGLGEADTLENQFEITQKIKRGKGPGKALFYLQVCTDTMCDRPRIHEIILE